MEFCWCREAGILRVMRRRSKLPGIIEPRRVRFRLRPTNKTPLDKPREFCWCAERESNPHDFWSRDFKSLASTYSAIRAYSVHLLTSSIPALWLYAIRVYNYLRFTQPPSAHTPIQINSWRHVRELHPSTRFCRPLRNCSANAPLHVIIANNPTNRRLLTQIVRFMYVFSKIKTQANARVNILVHWRRLELPRSQ